MIKSKLIEVLINRQPHLSCRLIEDATKHVFEQMSNALSKGERIEIRGFGSFSLRYRAPRTARNPKNGDTVQTASKFVVHFKPGKEFKERVNAENVDLASVEG